MAKHDKHKTDEEHKEEINMQDGSIEVTDPVGSTSPGITPELPQKNNSKKKFWLIAIIFVVIVLLVLGGWLFFVKKDSKQQQNSQQEKKESSSVLSYQECLGAEGSDIDEEGGTCVTDDGLIFYLGDDFSDNENNPDEDLTETEGSQSVTLEVGESTPAFLWGSPYLLAHVDSTLTLPVKVTTTNVNLSACSLMVKSTPDKPGITPISYSQTPKASQEITFIDGWHTVSVECRSDSGSPLKVVKEFGVADNKPELCADFSFDEPDNSSVTSVQELRTALNGTWEGCADLPFGGAPSSYYVVITFNPNGSYSASSSESLDGQVFGGGFYFYSAAGQQAGKIFGINSFSAGVGAGYLDIIGTISPDEGRVVRSDIRNVKVNGDVLSFDYHYRPEATAIHFKLIRQ